MKKIKPIIWKEFLDLSRDWRTLLSTILLPLVILPVLGFMAFSLSQEQSIQLIIVVEDNSTGRIGNVFFNASNITQLLFEESKGKNIAIREYYNYSKAVRENPYFDLILIISEDFVENATSLTRQGILKVVLRIGSAKSNEALNIVYGAVNKLNNILSNAKIKYLAILANVTVNPDSIRSPLLIAQPSYAGIGGKPASLLDELRAYTAKILMFALLFVTPPISSFMSDTIVGEKERKTLESLLTTPVTRTELLLGKLFAATVLGALAALADIVGVIGYFYTLSLAYGSPIPLVDPGLIALHSTVVFLTSLLTASIVLPLVLRSKTIRGAQASSTAVVSAATLVFFAVLFVDIPKLPALTVLALYLVPFTHSAMIIYNYIQGQTIQLLLHAGVIIAVSLALIALSAKMFRGEKIIASK